jgi:hypothetical protein
MTSFHYFGSPSKALWSVVLPAISIIYLFLAFKGLLIRYAGFSFLATKKPLKKCQFTHLMHVAAELAGLGRGALMSPSPG